MTFDKHYVGKHTVKYEGTLKKDTIQGIYTLPAESESGGRQGRFELKVDGRSVCGKNVVKMSISSKVAFYIQTSDKMHDAPAYGSAL